ncbi:MAG: signal recognition particle protein, partial [Rhodospirillaceae bacterium]|nr:signal recognition particle protein [Rhodospirillaceae bacterium]
MFDALTGRLSDVFDRLKRRGSLSEADVDAAMRDVRVALLEADVALPVVRDFIDKAKADAVGANVLRSVTPGQMVVKVVNDALVEMLGGEAEDLNLIAVPPVGVMLVGLQGSGKTTTTAKIALRLQNRDRKKVLMASLDTQRPAAQEQLKVLGEQAAVATLPVMPGQGPVDIAKRALEAARLGGYDVVLYDTAGRLSIDEGLMAEVAQVRAAVEPHETLLVADAMTGQDAVNVA